LLYEKDNSTSIPNRECLFSSAQLVLSSGSQIVVNSTSVLVVNDLTTAGGTIKNSGEVTVLGNITNNSGDHLHLTQTELYLFEGAP